MARPSSAARIRTWAAVETKRKAFAEARGPGGSVWKALELADELAAALDAFAAVRPRARPTDATAPAEVSNGQPPTSADFFKEDDTTPQRSAVTVTLCPECSVHAAEPPESPYHPLCYNCGREQEKPRPVARKDRRR